MENYRDWQCLKEEEERKLANKSEEITVIRDYYNMLKTAVG